LTLALDKDKDALTRHVMVPLESELASVRASKLEEQFVNHGAVTPSAGKLGVLDCLLQHFGMVRQNDHVPRDQVDLPDGYQNGREQM
jgi:hypothetical protein